MLSNRQATTDSRRPWQWLLLFACLAVAAGASFAPWVHRPPAALTLTAPDLAEFVKFLPQVRSGTLAVHRLAFLAPLFAVTFTLPMVAVSKRVRFPRLVQIVLLVAVCPLALTLLPPVWSPAVLTNREFFPQTVAGAACLCLLPASHWLHLVPDKALTPLFFLVWLAAPALALWQFYRVLPAVATAYAAPIAPAWGLWVVVVGSLGMMAAWYSCRPGRQFPG